MTTPNFKPTEDELGVVRIYTNEDPYHYTVDNRPINDLDQNVKEIANSSDAARIAGILESLSSTVLESTIVNRDNRLVGLDAILAGDGEYTLGRGVFLFEAPFSAEYPQSVLKKAVLFNDLPIAIAKGPYAGSEIKTLIQVRYADLEVGDPIPFGDVESVYLPSSITFGKLEVSTVQSATAPVGTAVNPVADAGWIPLQVITRNFEGVSTVAVAAGAPFKAAVASTADLANKQPLDADLTTIANLTPNNNDTLIRSGGNWVSRSMSQLAVLLGLKTAAYADLTTSSTDTTAGRVLKVGDMGIGAPVVSTETNLNNYLVGGKYVTPATGLTNLPSGWVQGRHIVDVSGGSASFSLQIIAGGNANLGKIAWRSFSGNTPTAWVELGAAGTSLGTAAYANLTTSALDSTAGNVLKVGDGGILGATTLFTGDINSLSAVPRAWVYCATSSGTTGTLPTPFGMLHTVSQVTAISQEWREVSGTNTLTNRRYFRDAYGNVTPGPWRRVYSDADVVSSMVDTTAGKLLTVGYAGLGVVTPTAAADIDSITLGNGWYGTTGTTVGTYPAGVNVFGLLFVKNYGSGYITQHYNPIGQTTAPNSREFIRTYNILGPSWNAWEEVLTSKLSQTSLVDTTAGKVLTVGSFGQGALLLSTGALTNINNIDLPTGDYGYANGATGSPPFGGPGILSVKRYSAAASRQTARPVNGSADVNVVYEREIYTGPVYGAWVEVITSASVQTSLTDSTANRLMKTGAFGWGGASIPILESTVNDIERPTGMYNVTAAAGGILPINVNGYLLHIDNTSAGFASQEYRSVASDRIFVRTLNASTWSTWREVYHSGNLDPATILGRTRPIVDLGSVPSNTNQTVTIDVNAAEYNILAVTSAGAGGSTAIAFSNIPDTTGKICSWQLELLRGGLKTVTFPSDVRWTSGVPTFQSVGNSRDVINFYRLAGRTQIYAMMVDAGTLT